ncbi:MAG: DUF4221 domain-containing protein [Tannerella sp.]|jgi:hypothetical protein|nr:DUF4221 domain-containing protein [Tannerella sp.]
MNKIYLVFLVCIFLSCNKNVLIDNKYGTPVELERIVTNVDLDDNTLNSYNLLSTLYYSFKDYIYAYNYFTHAIDIINITDNNVSHIKLHTEGSNGIADEITGLYISSPDSIWIATTTNIVLINPDGEIINNHSLLEKDSETALIMCNFSVCTSKIYYNPKRNSLFYLVMSVNDDKSTFFAEEHLLSDNTKKKYPLSFNTDKDVRNKYGWKQCPNITFTESNILYNLPIESNVYAIDIETGKNSVYGGKSRCTKNEVDELNLPYDFEQANRHYCNNVHFFEINYDPVNDFYYRLHLGEIAYDATQDFESILNKKDIYLMVFNNKFEVINETKLYDQRYGFRNCWGVSSQGFFITKSNPFYKDVNFEQFQTDIFHIE